MGVTNSEIPVKLYVYPGNWHLDSYLWMSLGHIQKLLEPNYKDGSWMGLHVCAWSTCVCVVCMCVCGLHVCVAYMCAWSACVCVVCMCVRGLHVCAWPTCVLVVCMCACGLRVCAWSTCVWNWPLYTVSDCLREWLWYCIYCGPWVSQFSKLKVIFLS